MVMCYLLFLFMFPSFPPFLALISRNRAVGGNGRWEFRKQGLIIIIRTSCKRGMRWKVHPRVWFPALACKSHDSKNWPVCLSSLSFCYFALFIVFMVVGLLTMSYGAFLPRLTIIKRNLKYRTSWERGMRRKVPSRVWSPALACVFPGFVHPSWHEMIWFDCSHGSLNLGILDDQTPSMHFGFGEEIMCFFQDVASQPGMAMTTKLWLPDLQMMGLLIVFGLFSRVWFSSLACPWPQIYGTQIYRWWVSLLLPIFGLFCRMWFPMASTFKHDGYYSNYLWVGFQDLVSQPSASHDHKSMASNFRLDGYYSDNIWAEFQEVVSQLMN